jgi:hypothetical protein
MCTASWPLRASFPIFDGVIIGKAVYEGRSTSPNCSVKLEEAGVRPVA